MNQASKSDLMMKFKMIFEAQKANLTYSSKVLNDDFNVKSEDMSDEVDLTSAELEQDMRMRLRSREFLFVKKIDEALQKIQAGTFGTCECCEEDIELSRLEARPTASLCILCKESEEAMESRSADGRKSKSGGSTAHLRTA